MPHGIQNELYTLFLGMARLLLRLLTFSISYFSVPKGGTEIGEQDQQR